MDPNQGLVRRACDRLEAQPDHITCIAIDSPAEIPVSETAMAMNSPSSPIEATRNASMMAAVMAAHDREKSRDPLDERDRDRMEQEELHRQQAARHRRGFFRRLLDRLPFG